MGDVVHVVMRWESRLYRSHHTVANRKVAALLYVFCDPIRDEAAEPVGSVSAESYRPIRLLVHTEQEIVVLFDRLVLRGR